MMASRLRVIPPPALRGEVTRATTADAPPPRTAAHDLGRIRVETRAVPVGAAPEQHEV